MTLFPVMGTALIRAVGVDKAGPPGPLLLLDSRFQSRLAGEIHARKTSDQAGAPLAIDWVHADIPLVTQIQSQAQLRAISSKEVATRLIAYQREFKLEKWVDSLQRYLDIDCKLAQAS
jgi:hypothetical protein